MSYDYAQTKLCRNGNIKTNVYINIFLRLVLIYIKLAIKPVWFKKIKSNFFTH